MDFFGVKRIASFLQKSLDSTDAGDVPPKVRVGCISWTYADWLGSFYPRGTNSPDYLSLYSKSFDLVEADSTFYRQPTAAVVSQWRERTPPGFLFSVKLPKRITHDARFSGIESELERFEKTVSNLDEKLICVMAQLPPQSKFESEFPKLESFLERVRLRYAFEFRNISWFNEDTVKLLSKHRSCLVWNVGERFSKTGNEEAEKFLTSITSDFLYVRFMGKFGEFKRFNKIQKDRRELVENWAKKISGSLESVSQAYLLVSNHFAGFAPETANQIRELFGMRPARWGQF